MLLKGAFFISTVLCAALSASDSDCGIRRDPSPRQKRIVNGEEAEAWPWMAVLRRMYNSATIPSIIPICGGAAIGDRWVLTAEHCVVRPLHDLVFGATNLDDVEKNPSVQIRHVASKTTYWDIHGKPANESSELTHDIAVIELDEPLKFSSSIRPICLPENDEILDDLNTQLTVIGHGLTTQYELTAKRQKPKDLRPIHSVPLRELHVRLANSTDCDEIQRVDYIRDALHKARKSSVDELTPIEKAQLHYRAKKYAQDVRLICAKRENSRGVCHGDSGSVLMATDAENRWFAYGVANSVTEGCANADGGDFYTIVAEHCAFIAHATGGEVMCVRPANNS